MVDKRNRVDPGLIEFGGNACWVFQPVKTRGRWWKILVANEVVGPEVVGDQLFKDVGEPSTSALTSRDI